LVSRIVDFFGPEVGPTVRPISFKVISSGGKMSFKVMSYASFKNNKNLKDNSRV